MATVVNDRDVLLLGISERDVNSQDATILITSDSPTFHVSATGTTTPSYITVTAHLLNIIGTASFTAAGATITDNGDNTATIAYNGMPGNSAVITASVTRNGSTYNASTTLTKVVDGSTGQTGSSASWVEISTFGGQVFSRATTAASFSPSSIVLNATPYGNNATAYQWQYWNGSGWASISGATSATYTVNSGDFTSSRNYRVQATINGTVYLDEMTLVQVTGGTNAISGFLTNQSITLAAASDGTVGSYASATGTFKVYDGVVDKTGVGVTYSVTSQNSCTASINSSGVYSITAMSADTASVALQAVYNGVTIPLTVTLSKSRTGVTGTPANQYATAYLYQWAASVPANPTGTSNYNWSTGANTGYVTGDGWSVSVPTNPGTANLNLFVVVAQIVAASGTTSSSVSYTSATVQAWTKNGATGPQGASGVQSATVTVYQWAASIPASPSGTATYTWSGGAISSIPSGWSSTAGTSPTPGMTLWAAKVYLTDSATVTQTSFNWTSSSVSSVGYAGSAGAQGASYVTAYCASSTATTTTAPAQTTGKTSLPATNDGGITGTWSSTVPSLTSGQYLYQSDGIYDPTTNKVTWSIPYWSSLKVGSLNAITTNTGNLTVSGTISSANGNFSVDSGGGVTMKSATIQDGSGNIILQAGVALGSQTSQVSTAINSAATTAAWSGVSGSGKPQDNATVGANATNLAVVIGGDNLLNNSGFDIIDANTNRPSGYFNYNNANISTSFLNVSGRLGGHAFAIRANATGATNWGLHTRTNIVDLDVVGGVRGGWQPNKTYVISFKARKVNGAALTTMNLQWNSSPATTVGVSNPILTTSWQQYTFRITWGSIVEALGAIYIDHTGTVAINDEIHIDELIVQEGDVYSEWFLSSREAATTATWSSVSGTGRPADNATVGATLGTNVSGQITSSNSSTLIGNQAINSVHISDLRTTNYAEDGSGNPTAGAKLASTGTAIKVAANSMQVGTQVLSDYWFRLLQGVDGNIANGRIIWRGNNDATTRGGAPNIACLSVIPKPAMANFTTNNLSSVQWQGDASGNISVYHSYVLTPTSYSGNTDNLDAMSQIHVQFFAKPTDLSPFIELYAACPSRTYDGATGAVRGTWALGFFFNGSSLANSTYPSASNPNLSGVAPNVVFDTNNGGGQYVYIGYLRIRIANSYGWSATQDFAPNGTRVSGSNANSYQNNVTLPTGTITGVAGSSGGGSGSQGGACPAPWVKVRLLSGKEVNASDLHNGAKLAAVNDNNMQPLPQGGTVRDLNTIWATRYRVKLTNGEATEWSENHRFAVAERGWVTVQNLRGGDQILGLKESIVESVLAVGEGQVVSFRVEGAGTYFAGGLLCHNTKASF